MILLTRKLLSFFFTNRKLIIDNNLRLSPFRKPYFLITLFTGVIFVDKESMFKKSTKLIDNLTAITSRALLNKKSPCLLPSTIDFHTLICFISITVCFS